MDPVLLDEVRELYATPPDAFVAARNDLVRALKQRGDRNEADAVARLRRPSWTDVALNRAAGERAESVDAFVGAARTARRRHRDAAEGRRSGSMPEALQAVRAAQAALTSAGDAALDQLGRRRDPAALTRRLGEVGGDSSLLDLLVAGVLGLDDGPLVAAFASAPVSDDRPTSPPSESADAADAADDAADAADDELRQSVASAARAARSAERDAAVATTTADRARDRRDRAVAAVEAAADAVREAQEALATAEAALAEHDRRLADAEEAAHRAASAAADATRHHADLAARLLE